jgi:nicotinamidase-related amidase
LLNVWREKGLQIFHVKHCSSNPDSKLAPGNPGNEFKDIVAPLAGETVLMKNVNSAFIGTNLKQQLDAMGITKVVIAGLTTDHCISTTVRMAGNYGYDTYVVSDATATFDKEGSDGQKFAAELMHETALASLNGEFAVVVKTEDLLNSLKL